MEPRNRKNVYMVSSGSVLLRGSAQERKMVLQQRIAMPEGRQTVMGKTRSLRALMLERERKPHYPASSP